MKSSRYPSLFRTIHRRLTLLCAATTAAILCLFSCLYLYLAEKTLQESQYSTFLQDMTNLTSSLKQQTVITHAYLNSLEQNNNYQIYLWDQEVPFLFNQIRGHTLSAKELDILLAHLPAASSTAVDEAPAVDTLVSDTQCTPLSSGDDWTILRFQTAQGPEYQVYLARLHIGQLSAAQQLADARSPGVTLVVAASLQGMQKQLLRQRLYFLLLDLAGILLLTGFAAFFTHKMLGPLQENHQRQIRFIADASHELRTPLAVIRACLSAKPPAYEQTIDRECDRMGHLIEDLLTLSRLEQSPQLQQQDVDLDTLLLTVYEQTEVLAARKGIRLTLQLPRESLPHIEGDPNRLEQLVTILLQNALSYTPAGGWVALDASASAAVQIKVSDNGPGISDADKAHIFERFYRAERSHTDRSHFGLGLCIAQEIALAHGGSLTVMDTDGGGATFCITLPYDRKSHRA